jgi:hypothetical protein
MKEWNIIDSLSSLTENESKEVEEREKEIFFRVFVKDKDKAM